MSARYTIVKRAPHTRKCDACGRAVNRHSLFAVDAADRKVIRRECYGCLHGIAVAALPLPAIPKVKKVAPAKPPKRERPTPIQPVVPTVKRVACATCGQTFRTANGHAWHVANMHERIAA